MLSVSTYDMRSLPVSRTTDFLVLANGASSDANHARESESDMIAALTISLKLSFY